jgi:ribonuclease P protein component
VIDRIQDRSTFQRFRTAARRTRAGELWCAALPDPAGREVRIAYAIGRPVGGAVVRNRLRRRLREIAREHEASIPPGSYLIGARPAAVTTSPEELSTMFRALIEPLRRDPS